MALSTRILVGAATARLPDSTWETVVLLTAGRCATSAIVTLSGGAKSFHSPSECEPVWGDANPIGGLS